MLGLNPAAASALTREVLQTLSANFFPAAALGMAANDPKNINDHHRLRAINILGDYGPLAVAALPALTTASENPNADIKKAAIGAIAKVKVP